MKKTLLLLAVIACVLSSCKGGGKLEIQGVSVKESKNDDCTLIDAKGNSLCKEEFNYASGVVNGYFYSQEENETEYQLNKIGEKSEKILGKISEEGLGIPVDGLLPLAKKGKGIAVYDTNGDKKFDLPKVKGKEITMTVNYFSEGLLAFAIEGENADEQKCGFIDENGEIVIDAKYDAAIPFNGNVTFVAKGNGDDAKIYLINKKGEEVKKLKDNSEPQDFYVYNIQMFFYNGRGLNKHDDKLYFIDEQGEETALPSKVKRVSEMNDKYYAYRNEDGNYGVNDLDGNIVIKDKYKKISLLADGKFLVVTDTDVCKILDSEESVVKELEDCNGEFQILNGITIFAYDGKEWQMFDTNGEELTKKTFAEVKVPYIGLGLVRSGASEASFDQSEIAPTDSTEVDTAAVDSDYFKPENLPDSAYSCLPRKEEESLTALENQKAVKPVEIELVEA